MNIRKDNFGKLPDGRPVHLFTLSNDNGITVRITNYGGVITSLLVPDKDGKTDNIVCGFDRLDDYLTNHPYFGCIVGRVANRIGGASFTLEGKTYRLVKNNGDNHLHGGLKGFDKVLWNALPSEEKEEVSVVLTYTSPHMEEGYPGQVECRVKYSLNNRNDLRAEYLAVTDRTTVINLTNHSYFNLTGFRELIHAHGLTIHADQFTECDENLIPTGRLLPVEGTFLDFRKPKPLGKHIDEAGLGYDHNFILSKAPGELALAAHVFEPISRRRMEVWTTQPGIQLYTANYLDATITGSQGILYRKHHAFCLETQHFPDSPNKPHFPSIVLKPGQEYRQTTVFRFPNYMPE